MSTLAERYQHINNQMQEAHQKALLNLKGEIAPPTLIAASKSHSAEKIRELYELGHRDFGENYVQELMVKEEQLRAWGCSEIRWHLIGHLQSNKVRLIAPFVACVHSVDSLRLIEALAKECERAHRLTPLPVFIEVNIDQQETKSGVRTEEVPMLSGLIQRFAQLKLLGLMCLPDPKPQETDCGGAFSRTKVLCDSLADSLKIPLSCLSMGMSSDFALAIEQGATHVRVGTALFGPRLPS